MYPAEPCAGSRIHVYMYIYTSRRSFFFFLLACLLVCLAQLFSTSINAICSPFSTAASTHASLPFPSPFLLILFFHSVIGEKKRKKAKRKRKKERKKESYKGKYTNKHMHILSLSARKSARRYLIAITCICFVKGVCPGEKGRPLQLVSQHPPPSLEHYIWGRCPKDRPRALAHTRSQMVINTYIPQRKKNASEIERTLIWARIASLCDCGDHDVLIHVSVD